MKKDLPTVKSPSASGQKRGDVQAQLATIRTHVLSPRVQNGPVSFAQGFVKGVLIQNKDGATYEGKVYDRWLTLRLPDGHELTIFDYELRDELLSINETYEMVLSPFVADAWLAETELAGSEFKTADWEAVVVDPEWEAPKNAFRIACEEFYEHQWILVATSYGNMILEPGDIEAEIKAGMVIQWTGTRPDLCAVV